MVKEKIKECRRQGKLLYHGGRSILPAIIILFVLVSALAVKPALSWLVNAALSASKDGFLTNNFAGIFSRPLLIIALAVTLIFTLLWDFFSITLVINGINMIRHGEHITLGKICLSSLKIVLRALKPRNWMILIMSGVILPFVMPVPAISFIQRIDIPDFIMDWMYDRPAILVLYALVIIAVLVLAIIWMFMFNRFVLAGDTFRQAAKNSRKMMRGRWIRCLWECLRAKVLALLPLLAIFIGVFAVIMGILLIFKNNTLALSLSVMWGYVIFPAGAVIIDTFANIEGFGTLDALYNEISDGGAQISETPATKSKPLRLVMPIFAIALAAVIVCGTVFMALNPQDVTRMILNPTTSITAHRGYTLTAPENTLQAYIDAIDSGIVEYGELDVQMTKDGYIVLNHDDTLERVANCDRHVYDLTLEELKQLTISTPSAVTGENVYGTITTLDEVINACKGKMKLNIEIKPCDKTPELEAKTVKIIEDNDFVDECVVTSLSYDVLKRVKEINPKIKCGYTLNMAVGQYYDLPACDLFSVESSFVNDDMVDDIHNRNKDVFCWTVASADTAREMDECGVDTIITNDPMSIATAITEGRYVPFRLYELYLKLTDKDIDESDLDEI